MRKIIISILLFVLGLYLSGCVTAPAKEERCGRKTIEVYDQEGKTTEHIIVGDGYITVYDKDWNTKGYGKVEKR